MGRVQSPQDRAGIADMIDVVVAMASTVMAIIAVVVTGMVVAMVRYW